MHPDQSIDKLPYIAMYHSVASPADRAHDPYRITVTPRRLDRQLDWLARGGLRGVSVRELLAARRRRGLVGLTFDDGYADFLQGAVPVLRRHGFTATVFVVAGRLGGTNGWENGGPVKPLLSLDELSDCAAAGMEIGSHGMWHLHVAQADPQAAAREIAASRELLGDLLRTNISGYCYAYGEYDARAVRQVRAAGYDYACAVRRSGRADRFTLPRTYVGQADHPARLLAKRVRAAFPPMALSGTSGAPR